MDAEDYSSDTSDDDYVPTGVESDCEDISGVDEDDATDDGDDDGDGLKKKKISRKKKLKKKMKDEPVLDKVDESEKQLTEEEQKEKKESLWASFKKDVDSVSIAQPKASASVTTAAFTSVVACAPEVKTVIKEYEFAGEKVKVTEQIKSSASSSGMQGVKRPPVLKTGGLSSIAGALSGKKQKLSTLEKSKLDWDSFKKDECIEEELKTFNQGKHGFLERKAFLERADVKQFEIERNFRMGRKTNR